MLYFPFSEATPAGAQHHLVAVAFQEAARAGDRRRCCCYGLAAVSAVVCLISTLGCYCVGRVFDVQLLVMADCLLKLRATQYRVDVVQSSHESRKDKARQKAGFVLNRVVPHERDQNEPSVITGMGAGRGLSLGLHMQYIIVTHSDQK